MCMYTYTGIVFVFGLGPYLIPGCSDEGVLVYNILTASGVLGLFILDPFPYRNAHSITTEQI